MRAFACLKSAVAVVLIASFGFSMSAAAAEVTLYGENAAKLFKALEENQSSRFEQKGSSTQVYTKGNLQCSAAMVDGLGAAYECTISVE